RRAAGGRLLCGRGEIGMRSFFGGCAPSGSKSENHGKTVTGDTCMQMERGPFPLHARPLGRLIKAHLTGNSPWCLPAVRLQPRAETFDAAQPSPSRQSAKADLPCECLHRFLLPKGYGWNATERIFDRAHPLDLSDQF